MPQFFIGTDDFAGSPTDRPGIEAMRARITSHMRQLSMTLRLQAMHASVSTHLMSHLGWQLRLLL